MEKILHIAKLFMFNPWFTFLYEHLDAVKEMERGNNRHEEKSGREKRKQKEMILYFGKMNPTHTSPDSKVHGAYMGPTWGRQDPGGPHVGPMNLAMRVPMLSSELILWSFKLHTRLRNPQLVPFDLDIQSNRIDELCMQYRYHTGHTLYLLAGQIL